MKKFIDPETLVCLKLDGYRYTFRGVGSEVGYLCWALKYTDRHTPIDPVVLVRGNQFIISCKCHTSVWEDVGWREYK